MPDGAPLTFDTMAQAYLEDYVLQRYRTLTTARARVEHLRGFFGGWAAEAMTPDSVRNYQLHRRKQGAEAATVNRETSALSRMFQLAIRRGQLERMPLFPKRLEENPPRDGFFEHAEYLKVRAQLPTSFQDVLDFAYYSGWRRNEILELTWDEVDMKGGVIRLPPRRSKTKNRPRAADLPAAAAGAHAAPSPATGAEPARVSVGTASPFASGAPRFATRVGRPRSRTDSSTIVDAPPRGT